MYRSLILGVAEEERIYRWPWCVRPGSSDSLCTNTNILSLSLSLSLVCVYIYIYTHTHTKYIRYIHIYGLSLQYLEPRDTASSLPLSHPLNPQTTIALQLSSSLPVVTLSLLYVGSCGRCCDWMLGISSWVESWRRRRRRGTTSAERTDDQREESRGRDTPPSAENRPRGSYSPGRSRGQRTPAALSVRTNGTRAGSSSSSPLLSSRPLPIMIPRSTVWSLDWKGAEVWLKNECYTGARASVVSSLYSGTLSGPRASNTQPAHGTWIIRQIYV